jgi:hypothetical protein
MKIFNRPVMVLAALWCMAVILVPVAHAAEQGTGTLQAPGGFGSGPGDQGNTNQMQAPPSGSPGPSGTDRGSGGRDSGNAGSMRAPPGNMGNMTAPGGAGGFQNGGNMTLREPPERGDRNFTAMGGPGGGRGDGNITVSGSGNMTPPGFGNETYGMTGGYGMHGNSTVPGRGPGGMSSGNTTAPPDRPADGSQGGQDNAPSSGNQSQARPAQQSQEDLIASLIKQLQGLLSGTQ